MSENSSPLDLSTLWVECKNADGRVSVFLRTLHLHRRSFPFVLDLFLQC